MGLSVEETIAVTKQTCEAYKSCQPILQLADNHGIEMPITYEVVQVLHHGKPPAMLLKSFMQRDTKAE